MEYIKEELEELILVQNIPYNTIGLAYGCTGANIRKIAKKLGIELPVRRKINECETFNKGIIKGDNICLNCGKSIKINSKYCDNICQRAYENKQYIISWQQGEVSGLNSGKWEGLSGYIRTYIFKKYENKCCLCGWDKKNEYTNLIPLEIDHIDGDAQNNIEDNLRLICPNCHSLTENYRGANKGKGTRNITWIKN